MKKEATLTSVSNALLLVADNSPSAENLPDHPFFQLPRWSSVFGDYIDCEHCFVEIEHTEIDSHYHVASAFKNYDGEAEAFWDWILPHIDETKPHYAAAFSAEYKYQEHTNVNVIGIPNSEEAYQLLIEDLNEFDFNVDLPDTLNELLDSAQDGTTSVAWTDRQPLSDLLPAKDVVKAKKRAKKRKQKIAHKSRVRNRK